MPGITDEVAAFVVDTSARDIPDDVMHLGKRSVLDGIGLALAGAASETGEITRKYLKALGFAAEGEGHKLVEAEATTYGGDGPVVNPSGGLISKGHPLGATGLAQCSELTWQLRGTADKRQVDGATVGLQHNLGLGGAAVVTMYRKED